MVPGGVNEELNHSSAVFSGKVIDIIDMNKNNSTQSSIDPIGIVFEVNEAWKGIDETQVIVFTERDSASCGFEFLLNEEYLVYANENGGELRTTICSRTALLSSAQADLDELGVGQKPTKQVTIDVDELSNSYIDSDVLSDTSSTNYLLLLIPIGLIAILLIVFMTKRKKQT